MGELCVLQEIFHGVSGRFPEARDRLLQIDESVECRAPRIPVEEHVDLRFPPLGSLSCAAREVACGAWAVVVMTRPSSAIGRGWTSAVRAWPAHEVARSVIPRVPADCFTECPSVLSSVIHLAGNKMENKSVESNGRGGVCRSFHVVSFLSGEAERRFPPVPHLFHSPNPKPRRPRSTFVSDPRWRFHTPPEDALRRPPVFLARVSILDFRQV